MTTLYFHPLSTPSLYPLFIASALGLEHEKTMVNLQTQEQKGEAYLSVNPFGRVPALVDGDLAVGESAAIGRYLAQTHAGANGTMLYADTPKEQALIDQWVEFVAHHIRVNVNRIQFNRFIAPMIGEEVDEASIALGERFLTANLPHIELALSGDGVLHGDRLTLADLALVAAMEPQYTAKLDLGDYPVITDWLAKTRQSDWYQAVHSHFGAEMGLPDMAAAGAGA